jgi:phage FluMu protein Com
MIASSLLASVTVTVTAYVVVYYDVRCPKCHRVVMCLPNRPPVDTVAHRAVSDRLGKGAVVACPKCKALVEAIPHAA